MARQRRRGTVERLERRYALTQFGVPWPDPQHLTFSFVPDGTLVGDNQTSDLFAALNNASGVRDWQAAVMQALQTWAADADLNFALVRDQGEPLGSAGLAQGDPRFGDIRFAAAPLSSDVVALGMPFSFAGGTLSGDIVFNSNFDFGEDARAQYDLFSVALHEIGHVLGLPDSVDASSAMCLDYLGIRSGLSPEDISAVDAVYGARPLDTSNQTPTSPTLLTLGGESNAAVVDAQLATPTDTHYYQLPIAANQTTTIVLHTSGVSLVEPRLTVYDGSGNVVASAVSSSPNSRDLVVQAQNPAGNTVLLINVSSATAGVFGVGAYRLAAVSGVNVPDDLLQGPQASGGQSDDSESGDGEGDDSESDDSSPNGQVTTGSTGPAVVSSTSGASPAGTASENETNGGGANGGGRSSGLNVPSARHSYSFRSTLVAPTDVQYQRVRVPVATGSGTTTLTASVWAGGAGAAAPIVTVLDANGNQVPAEVLENANGTYSVQVMGVAPGAVYTLAVSAANPIGSATVGSYRLTVDFDSTPAVLTNFVAGTLTASASQQFQTVELNTSQFFHFLLSANTLSASGAPAAVRMTIYDPTGNIVQSLVGQVGSALSTTLLLGPGTYVFRFAGGTQDNSPLPDTTYQLQGLGLGDPIGPTPVPPFMMPPQPPPPPPFVFSVPTVPLYLQFLTLNDPYGRP
ncbi:MAG TPA: matrixin family metalloprotease [Pirellulales bacterium]|nr:matrixin family metalloprotease [Pirellulales bacterium]